MHCAINSVCFNNSQQPLPWASSSLISLFANPFTIYVFAFLFCFQPSLSSLFPPGHCSVFVSYKFSLLCLGLVDFYFLIPWAYTSSPPPGTSFLISGLPTSSNLSRSCPCNLQLIHFLSLCFFSTVFQLCHGICPSFVVICWRRTIRFPLSP